MTGVYNFTPGEVAVITGGATGIGLALARLLAGESVTVVVLHLPQTELPTNLEATYVACDVRDEAGVARTFARVAEDFGRIDMVANVAALLGLAVEAPLLEHPAELFREVMDVNVVGQFLVIRESARQMVALGCRGRIVNVSSVRGHLGVERAAAYVASKHGVLGLTRAAALELAPHGIRVNAVAPGYVASELALAEEPYTTTPTFRKKIPIAEYAQPVDAARVIAALLSADSNFVTGSVWDIDGGVRAY